jgi:LCP family protein required for cell wall assembly
VPESMRTGQDRAAAAAAARSDWGPVVSGSARRRGRRLTTVLVAVLVLVLIAPSVVALRLPRQEVAHLAERGRPFHVLITGSDSRAGLTAQERIELSTGSAGGERTDTILVMSIVGTRVGLLAFPRDLMVERCDGSVGRINGAVGIGGPSCLVETVSRVSGLPIRHHLSITFGGFRDVVDAVGGVELCLDRPIRDRSAGIDLPAGCQVLAGADALGFVRVRKIDSDLMRIQRQQQFLRALAQELVSPTLLLQPWRLVRLADGMAGAVEVDQRLGGIALWRLAFGLRSLASGRAVTSTVPSDPGRTSAGASVLRMRTAEAEALFGAFGDGSALSRRAAAGGA